MDYFGSLHSGGSSSRRPQRSSGEDVYRHPDTPRPTRAASLAAAARGYASSSHTSQQGQQRRHRGAQQSNYKQQLQDKLAAIDAKVRSVIDDPFQLHWYRPEDLQVFVNIQMMPVEGKMYKPSKENMRIYLIRIVKIDEALVNQIIKGLPKKQPDGKLKPRQDLDFARTQALGFQQCETITQDMIDRGIMRQLQDNPEPERWEEITRNYLIEDQSPSSARMRVLYRWIWQAMHKRRDFLTRMDIAREKYYNEKYVLPSNFWQNFYDSADPRYRHISASDEASTSVATEEEAQDEDVKIEDQEEQEEEEQTGNQEKLDLNLTLGGAYAGQSHATSAGRQASPQAASAFDTSSWQQFSSAIPYYDHSGHSTQMYGYSHQRVNPQAQHLDSSLPYLQQNTQQQQQQQYVSGRYGYSHQNVSPAQYYDPNQQYQQQVYLQQQQQFGQRGRFAERREERRSGEQAGGSQGANYYGGGSSSGYYR